MFAAVTLYAAFFTKSATAPQRDLLRVASELQDLSPGEEFEVFLTGSNYSIVLYGAAAQEKPKQCSTKSCVCVFEAGAQTCEVLKTTETQTSCISKFDPSDANKYRRSPLCVNANEYLPVEVPVYDPNQPRQTVAVCRGGDRLAIAATVSACEDLTG
jgi:hypothetical protein